MRASWARKIDVLVCNRSRERPRYSERDTISIARAAVLAAALNQLRGPAAGRAQSIWLPAPYRQLMTVGAARKTHPPSKNQFLVACFRIAMRDLEIRGSGRILARAERPHHVGRFELIASPQAGAPN